jgi:Family of unknown function (DUF6338)
VVLLTPGLFYVLRRECTRPDRTISTFRETVELVVLSLACDVTVGAAFAVTRIRFPSRIPDVGALIHLPADDAAAYARAHYASLGWWSLGLLIAACLLGVALASIDLGGLARGLGRIRGLRWLAPAKTVTSESAWWRLFHLHPDSYKHVGCNLDDSSFISGWLLSYSPDNEETGDRELTLSAPLFFRPAGAVDGVTLGERLARAELARMRGR